MGGCNTKLAPLALKTKAKTAHQGWPAGTLPWLGIDRIQPNRWFSRASNVESMQWMVLHRSVELAALIVYADFCQFDFSGNATNRESTAVAGAISGQ